jgi:hypothetical protein
MILSFQEIDAALRAGQFKAQKPFLALPQDQSS